MFIQLTDMDGEKVWINADKIMWIVPYRTKFVIPWNEAETPKDLADAWNRRANDD